MKVIFVAIALTSLVLGCSEAETRTSAVSDELPKLDGLYRFQKAKDYPVADDYVDLFFRKDGVVESKWWTWGAAKNGAISFDVGTEYTGKFEMGQNEEIIIKDPEYTYYHRLVAEGLLRIAEEKNGKRKDYLRRNFMLFRQVAKPQNLKEKVAGTYLDPDDSNNQLVFRNANPSDKQSPVELWKRGVRNPKDGTWSIHNNEIHATLSDEGVGIFVLKNGDLHLIAVEKEKSRREVVIEFIFRRVKFFKQPTNIKSDGAGSFRQAPNKEDSPSQ